MYTPYLICGYVATLAFLLIGFRVIRRTSPELRGQQHLQRYLLFNLAALLLFGARTLGPAFVTTVLPNFLIFGAAISLYLAAADILKVTPRFLPWLVNLCLTAFAPFLWFTYIQPAVLPRLLIHSVVLAVISSITAVLLLRHQDAALRSPLRACGRLLLCHMLLQVTWSTAAILRPIGRDFMHVDLAAMAFSYLSVLLGAACATALLWLSLCVHRTQLHHMAQTDSLTGLLNRRAFEEIVRRELPRSSRPGRAIGMLLIDIDHFKLVNDSQGHPAGDEVLRRISVVLQQSTRVSDVIARYGGEEFVVLLRDAGLEESAATAERIRREIACLSGLPGGVSLTASVGVAIGDPSENAATFLLRADEALYNAKRGGRNLVSIYRAVREPVVVL